MRKLLCDTGRLLIEKGLVARTWGNLSLRNGDSFLITPSGRSYETLTPDDIVRVSLADLSYQGNIKPSSEKNLHQIIYLQFPAANAIIHTHQPGASAVAAARRDIPPQKKAPSLLSGKTVSCAPYALPTTKQLAQSVAKVIRTNDTPAVLLANHGAVCWGASIEEALDAAENLEKLSQQFILDNFKIVSGQGRVSEKAMIDYYVKCKTTGVSNG